MKSSKIVPLRQFRVYPETGTSLYWTVMLFSTVKEMRKHHAVYRGVVNADSADDTRLGTAYNALALCASTRTVYYRKGKKPRYDPCLGRIYLNFDHIGAGVLSHEASHATRYYLNRQGLSLDPPEMDERFADIVGNIVKGMTRRIW